MVYTSYTRAAILQSPSGALIRVHRIDNNLVCIGPIALENSEESRDKAINHCLDVWNTHCTNTLAPEDIIYTHSVALAKTEDPSKTCSAFTQESYLDLNNPGGSAPLLNVFGIDFTQFRKRAEQALDILAAFTHRNKNADYRNTELHGGDFDNGDVEAYFDRLKQEYSFLDEDVIRRWVLTYGRCSDKILDGVRNIDALGRCFGHGLFEAELDYLKQYEWADSADDVLWRRTYLGMFMSDNEHAQLKQYLGA